MFYAACFMLLGYFRTEILVFEAALALEEGLFVLSAVLF